jgi:hypothetical protein
MMTRPWQIWSLFGLCLAMVLPAMIWLTHKAIQLDRAEALAQQHAELEEIVGSALWQMDTELTGLLAVEIARPSSFYQGFVSRRMRAASNRRSGHRLAPTVALCAAALRTPAGRHLEFSAVSRSAASSSRSGARRHRGQHFDAAGSGSTNWPNRSATKICWIICPSSSLKATGSHKIIGSVQRQCRIAARYRTSCSSIPSDLPVVRQQLEAVQAEWPELEPTAGPQLPAGTELEPSHAGPESTVPTAAQQRVAESGRGPAGGRPAGVGPKHPASFVGTVGGARRNRRQPAGVARDTAAVGTARRNRRPDCHSRLLAGLAEDQGSLAGTHPSGPAGRGSRAGGGSGSRSSSIECWPLCRCSW